MRQTITAARSVYRLALSIGVLVTSLCVFVGSGFAHHGTNASYDTDKQVTLTGVITEFVWSNPHCQIYFDVKDEKGNLVHWGAETNSPGQLRTGGWSRETLKAGDQVTVTLDGVAKSGAPIGRIKEVMLADGTVMRYDGAAGGGGN